MNNKYLINGDYFNAINFHLKKYRMKIGISQKELSRLSGVSAAAISLIENGSRMPMLDTAICLARSLNLSIYDICEIQEKPVSSNLQAENIMLKQALYEIRKLSTRKVEK